MRHEFLLKSICLLNEEPDWTHFTASPYLQKVLIVAEMGMVALLLC